MRRSAEGSGVDERLLKLPETVAIAPEGGVLVPQLLILAEELAVLFLQAVEIADVAEEVRDGTERRRSPFLDRAGGPQEEILDRIEEAGAPGDGEQDGQGDHGPQPSTCTD